MELPRKREKHSSFRFRPEIKAAFKAECDDNGTDMTTVLEQLMISYVTSSRKLKRLKNAEEEE